jgi:type IV pilus assembly protein PilA
MLTAIKRRTDREDDGFTLIELMVVVLIIAILLAIAIPTFLGARDAANARAAQADLRNALTAEQTEWTNTQGFASTAATMQGIEQGLTWTTGVAATTGTATTPVVNEVAVATDPANDEVVLQAQGKDNNCYYIEQSDNATYSFTGYGVISGSCGVMTAPTASPTSNPVSAGSASAHIASSGTGNIPTTFYSTF